MKRSFFILFSALLLGSASAQAQGGWGVLKDVYKGVRGGTGTGTGTGGTLGSLSSTEIVNGLKEALNIGSKNASGKLNVANGFFGNAIIRVLMPPEAKKVESTLRSLGMNKMVDNVILSMNRAAEDAAGKAAPIFINAITSMSITDGINILRGGSGAATNYLKSRTLSSLTAAFRPVIENSLNKVNATKYWRDAFSAFNSLPTTRTKVNTDLTAYVTERALNGLFVTIAEEENNIRSNPAARVTGLLQKVFGAK
jgi:hypothetical protein